MRCWANGRYRRPSAFSHQPSVFSEAFSRQPSGKLGFIMLRPVSLTVLAFVLPLSAPAQHGAAVPQAPASAPAEARQHDFLVGQWELVVKVPPAGLAQRIHGVPRLRSEERRVGKECRSRWWR